MGSFGNNSMNVLLKTTGITHKCLVPFHFNMPFSAAKKSLKFVTNCSCVSNKF